MPLHRDWLIVSLVVFVCLDDADNARSLATIATVRAGIVEHNCDGRHDGLLGARRVDQVRQRRSIDDWMVTEDDHDPFN